MEDGSGFIELATTRPETLLGDTAVAVNPKDERYTALVGKNLILPLVGRKIPIIADDYVEMDFGTGVVKITPAHDPNDFEVGLRHQLPVLNVLTDDAKIVADYPKYAGLDRYEARKAIVADLEAAGVLVKTEDHAHNVGTCYRCGTTVEPRVSKQWFVKMKPLAGPAIEAVKKGDTKFVPARFEKIYFHWLENIRDWCISRQLWWGHRIPAWYCAECGEVTVSKTVPQKCCKCGGTHLTQDEDTLDTWFSSALWPFSTLGWPNTQNPDYQYFYPTNTLVTGYDIIPFWVMRMMFSGLEHTGRVPFDTVLIHGLVRDSQGRKMSKSLGNGVDPLEVIDQYGADALRFSLATGNSPGNDMRYIEERVIASRNFANKIWNAARFVLMNLPENEPAPHIPAHLAAEDKWILSKFNTLVAEVTANLDKFELGLAVSKLYDFIWDVFCDWYIELAKQRFQTPEKEHVMALCVNILYQTLKALHPLIPFVTEEIATSLRPYVGETEEFLLNQSYPQFDAALCHPQAVAKMDIIQGVTRVIRTIRSQFNVPPGLKISAVITAKDPAELTVVQEYEAYIKLMAKIENLTIEANAAKPAQTATAVFENRTVYVPLTGLIDFDKERKRLEKELAQAQANIASRQARLSQENFIKHAPAEQIQKTKDELAAAQLALEQVTASLEDLN